MMPLSCSFWIRRRHGVCEKLTCQRLLKDRENLAVG
jgi:hypothetical protein